MPKAADQDRWTIAAKNILKSELKRRGVTYAQLAQRLAEQGVSENERNLNNKISRGGFTFHGRVLHHVFRGGRMLSPS